jgi:hypothetical protein
LKSLIVLQTARRIVYHFVPILNQARAEISIGIALEGDASWGRRRLAIDAGYGERLSDWTSAVARSKPEGWQAAFDATNRLICELYPAR